MLAIRFLATLVALVVCSGLAQGQETSFTYNGRLTLDETPLNSDCDMRFRLYNAQSGGSQVGSDVFEAVEVSDGLFSIELDFGAVFDGTPLWLETAVSCPSSEPLVPLSPRQKLTAVPYSVRGFNAPFTTTGSTTRLNAGMSLTVGTDTFPDLGSGLLSIVSPNGNPGLYVERLDGIGTAIDIISDGGTAGAMTADAGGIALRAASLGNGIGVHTTAENGGDAILAQTFGSGGLAGHFQNIQGGSGGTAILATGSGTTKLRATVRIENDNTNAGMAMYSSNDSSFANTHFYNSGNGQVLWLENGGTNDAGTGGGDFITAVNDGAGDFQFRVLTNGDVMSDGSFNGSGADYAEWLERAHEDEVFAPGDVVGVRGGKISRDTTNAEQVMVISTNPLLVGNQGSIAEANREGFERVTFIGQAPVRVRGPVATGDFIIASGQNDGTAIAMAPDRLSLEQLPKVIGAAWQSTRAMGVSRINVAIGIDQTRAAALAMDHVRVELISRRREVSTLHDRLAQLEDLLLANGVLAEGETR